MVIFFFFPVINWSPLEAAAQCSAGAAGGQTSIEKAKKGKIAWLCTGICGSHRGLGCQGVAPGAGTCWALLPVHGLWDNGPDLASESGLDSPCNQCCRAREMLLPLI